METILSEITIDTDKCTYTTDDDGNITNMKSTGEKSAFHINLDMEGLEMIFSKLSPSDIPMMGGVTLHFEYTDNELSSVTFVNDDYLYMVIDIRELIDKCLDAFIRQKIMSNTIRYINNNVDTSKFV